LRLGSNIVTEEIGTQKVRAWLYRIDGSGFDREVADRVIAEMKALGSKRLFPHLREILTDSDSQVRCLALLAICHIDPTAGIDLLLPMLDDPDVVVRWHVCGLLHDIRDRRAIEPLIRIMKSDPDPQVRNTAAYALGGIGDPVAIPALIQTLDNDHQVDELGYTASSCAATALDNIIGTNHTRIKLPGGFCTMAPGKPDLDLLKAQAMEVYRNRPS
jgi:hypothetical protein